MRPAQLTPENNDYDCHSYPNHHRFNEAGAINAGKPTVLVNDGQCSWVVSMRPAQLTSENAGITGDDLEAMSTFQ